jgi:hypothetical protein
MKIVSILLIQMPFDSYCCECTELHRAEEEMKSTRKLIAAVAIGVGALFALVAPAAHADTQDQQFLNLAHSNGVGGQDDSLVAYAHEFCNTNGAGESSPRRGLVAWSAPDSRTVARLSESRTVSGLRDSAVADG